MELLSKCTSTDTEEKKGAIDLLFHIVADVINASDSLTTLMAHDLYACESWTLTAELEKRTQAFEMRFYRRLLNISYKDHVTNKELRRKIQAAIGKYDEILTLVKKRKRRWFGHVSRSFGLAKAILQYTVKGKRKKRQTEEEVGREDNIKEWTGMDFASSTRAAENRMMKTLRWKGIVANSSVVPRRHSKVMG